MDEKSKAEKPKRKAISKKTRFEVFKRDAFSCQYCGASAPNVILHVDHINPVAAGGSNEILNLVTACMSCNAGKGARKLSDGAVVQKQIDQMKAISVRQEQLAMMAEWRNGMMAVEENAVEVIVQAVDRYLEDSSVASDLKFRHDVRGLLKRYSVEDIFSAIDKSAAGYLRDSDSESVAKFLNYIPKIAYWQKVERENPTIARVNKIVGMAAKKWWRCDRSELHRAILIYHERDGISLDTIMANALDATGIMKFRDNMAEVIDG